MKLLLMKMDSLIEHKMSIKNVFGSEIVDLGCFSKRMKKTPLFSQSVLLLTTTLAFIKPMTSQLGNIFKTFPQIHDCEI